uniref:Uncharacterized protein n=1 Tax=Arundo donax TaxID=35708 RepID=A0A0A9C7H3_ARUDO
MSLLSTVYSCRFLLFLFFFEKGIPPLSSPLFILPTFFL